jgi:hypothetical protein
MILADDSRLYVEDELGLEYLYMMGLVVDVEILLYLNAFDDIMHPK